MTKRTPGLGLILMMAALALPACGDGGEADAGLADEQPAAEETAATSEAGTASGTWAARTGGQIADIPFPVYPGATLSAYTTDLEPGELQALTLQTPDPTDEVVTFYSDELSGYRSREQWGTHTFWQGAESFDPLEDTGIANIQVRESMSSDSTFIYMFFPAGS